jgi:aquaporin Z
MRKYLAELIGTFFLVLVVGCTAIGAWPGVIAPLAIGATLMVMVFATGHVSGGHLNPAVTLGVWMRGRCNTRDVIPYMLAQVIGAALAAVMTGVLLTGREAPGFQPVLLPAFVAELLFTFALVYVVLNTATAKGTVGNSFYGLAIGMTVMAGAFAVGNVSGGVFNPAVAVGISILGLTPWSMLWLYLLAELAGGALAVAAFRMSNPEDR